MSNSDESEYQDGNALNCKATCFSLHLKIAHDWLKYFLTSEMVFNKVPVFKLQHFGTCPIM